MQLASDLGERTFLEVVLQLNKEQKNLTLFFYSYCITGIQKSADILKRTKQTHIKLAANLMLRILS